VDSSRSQLPTGVVTFLLTDIEGSTRRWEREPEAMRQALVRHDAIVTACVRRQQGHVVKSKGEGDSVFAVFRHARDAASAALITQCVLAAEEWPTSTPIRVRMAIHTGQIELRDGDYYGPTVNRCARLRALGKGGQVLLSGVTAKLVHTQLPTGGSLKDLGTHQLKDLSAPERVFQLAHPQMPVIQTDDASAAKPSSAPLVSRLAYVVTDHLSHSADGREWGPGVRRTLGALDEPIRCFTSPTVAAFMNAVDLRFRLPKLWEASVDANVSSTQATVDCRDVKALRQVPLPNVTGVHLARFAVLCARAAYEDGLHSEAFMAWADSWFAGQDNSGIAARELADVLERSAERSSGLVHPEDLMAANAARAVTHAVRTTWLVGRARDEENTRAIDLAADAVHTALKITRLELPALAKEALGEQPRIRPLSIAGSVQPSRILTALPT
jgi:class 3 adenylate cyclase